MSITDPIADTLVKLKNASMVFKGSVDVPFSRMTQSILEILKREHYIAEIKPLEQEGSRKRLRVYLKYYAPKKPVLTGIQRRSKPGLRVYSRCKDMPFVLRGKGLAVVSTSKGLMTNKEARGQKIGGEVLFYIW